jgi:hypothetical protein
MRLLVYVAVQLGRKELLEPKVQTYHACPKGHPNSSSYAFCPRCGGAVTERSKTIENDALTYHAKTFKCTKEVFWDRLASGEFVDDEGFRALTLAGKEYIVSPVRRVSERDGMGLTSTDMIRDALDTLSSFCIDCGLESLQEDGAEVLILPDPDEST